MSPLAPYGWASVIFGIVAFLLFLIPATRRRPLTMNLGCFLIYASVYIEKGIALIIPGYTPDTLGEIYEYFPSITELRISAGVFALGFFIFTLMVKVAIGIIFEDFTVDSIRGEADVATAKQQPATA
jgi:molybdopterin-containing oxidoreductase family membrane subunit